MANLTAFGSETMRTVVEAAVGSQYEVLRLLGVGGMGAVYLARERLLERLVAVKILRPELVGGETRARFIREAKTAARLTHAHIVPLYSFGQAGDTLFYVMGYVEGESLEARLARTGRVSSEEARRILIELADALDYAHRLGVVHRDIKPDNVMIDRDTGRAILTDFGIAKEQASNSTLTRTGIIIGTPRYMSPEQASGDRDVDGRSDLYALGVIGYRMLAGRLPFDGETIHELLVQHAVEEAETLEVVAAHAPAELSWAVMRCLEKQPSDRWPTAAELRDALSGESGVATEFDEAVDHVAGRGVRVGLALWVAEMIALFAWSWTRSGAAIVAMLAIPIVLGAVMLAAFAAARRIAGSPRGTWRLLWAPPVHWWGWWPMALRRSNDIWSRLPPEIRDFRESNGFYAATTVGALLPLTVAVMLASLRLHTWPSVVFVLIVFLAVAVGGLFVGRRRRAFEKMLRARGIPRSLDAKIAREPTRGSRFWRRPEVAPLLTDALPSAVKSAIDDIGEDAYCDSTPIHPGMFDHIDPRSPTPLYAQIASRLRVAIASGELGSGEPLPSVRQLAARLRINPATVVQAYRDLEKEGLVSTRHGSGTFVQEVAPERRDKDRAAEATRLVRELLSQAGSLGIPVTELRAAVERELDGGGKRT